MAAFVISVAASAQTPQKRADRQNNRSMWTQREHRVRAERDTFFTVEQKEAMKEIRLETAKEVKPLRDQLRELSARHKTLTTSASADLDAIYENIEKMAETKTEMAKIRARQHQEVRGLLTEEQLLKFDNHKEMMNKRRSHSFDKGDRDGRRNFKRPGRG